ncbi:hypothetical protein GCM10010381_50140 [Streptomyces xantholiticus]|nr:hypothetical protein GCM10010381_50140 [Streptomyces xantholiticus]
MVWYTSGALCAAAALMALVIRRKPVPKPSPVAVRGLPSGSGRATRA